tara:strand:- start:412 stop:633 length:222 start_codon:yes stop_codon:yes gene_type:complete
MSKKEENEMLLLMKELVNKVNALEDAVYNKDNMLMKAGLVVRETPTPVMNNTQVPDGGTMSWDEIRKMTEKMG